MRLVPQNVVSLSYFQSDWQMQGQSVQYLYKTIEHDSRNLVLRLKIVLIVH